MAIEGLLATWARDTAGMVGFCVVGRSDHSHLKESGCLRTDRAASTFHELTIHQIKFVISVSWLQQRVQQGKVAHPEDPVEGVQVQVLLPLFPQQGYCFNS